MMAFWFARMMNFLSYSTSCADILPEEGEGRIRDHDVRLLQEFDGLRAAEIAVAFQEVDLDLVIAG